jgi:hypothetical protein
MKMYIMVLSFKLYLTKPTDILNLDATYHQEGAMEHCIGHPDSSEAPETGTCAKTTNSSD